MVLVLVKYGKNSNVHVAGSAVTVVLKKAIPAVRKSCDSYHEKAVPVSRKAMTAIMKKLSQLSGKAVCFG